MENEEGGAEDEKVIKMLEPFFHVRRAETFLPAFFSIRAPLAWIHVWIIFKLQPMAAPVSSF